MHDDSTCFVEEYLLPQYFVDYGSKYVLLVDYGSMFLAGQELDILYILVKYHSMRLLSLGR